MDDPEKAALETGDNADMSVSVEEEDDDVKSVSSKSNEDERRGIELVSLPIEVRQRVKALKKIQVDITKIEARFYEEMHNLECKYSPLYLPYFEKRKQITAGAYEPTEDECDFVGASDSEDVGDVMTKLKIEACEGKTEATKATGIPDFWLTIFRNVEMLSEIMQSHDEPILKHLDDVKVEMIEKPMGFKLLFFFSPNEYFSNSVLTKTYEMKCEIDVEDPFSFEGPEIVKCTGCPIDWAKGKNVTVKTVRKKQKHKQRGSIRTVSKTVENPSFFNFFNPPQVPEEVEADMDEETQMRLTHDFEVGQYIRERIVPRAVLYFTGEALEEDYEEEEEEENEEEEDEEEDPPAAARGQKFNRKSQTSAQKQNPECKQQ